MNRKTTLHGAFHCQCGGRSCYVHTKFVQCCSCSRLYTFGAVVGMIEDALTMIRMETRR